MRGATITSVAPAPMLHDTARPSWSRRSISSGPSVSTPRRVGRDAVAGRDLIAGEQRRQRHAGGVDRTDRLGEVDPRRSVRAVVAHAEVDAAGVADGEHRRDAPTVRSRSRGRRRRTTSTALIDGDEQPGADDEQLEDPEHPPDDAARRRLRRRSSSPDGSASQRATGTGTSASTSPMASAADIRAPRSARSTRRCASAGTATLFTSSGVA